jgi:hypothetical protein
MSIIIKQRDTIWQIELRDELFEFPTREDFDAILKEILAVKDKFRPRNNKYE